MATWGNLRFLLLQAASGQTPAPSLDLIDSWLNSRYGQVLEANGWIGLRARTTLTTTAAYQSGTDTVTLTVGSAAVTGTGTSWTSGRIGMRFYRPGDTVIYTVTAVGGATSLTLDRPYEGNGVNAVGTVYAASGYVFHQDVYALPADARGIESVIDVVTGFPMQGFTQAELEQSIGPRTLIADPESYAEIEDTAEPASGATLHQLQFYPPPRFARGYTLEYLREANRFNGTNLAQSPLPFVSDTVLLNGVRADISIWQGNLTVAAAYEAKFREELQRLQLLEHSQRKKPARLQMADRFTRHRLARAERGCARSRINP